MSARFAAIWFPHLETDYMIRRQPELKETAFALAVTERGKRLLKAVSSIAASKGVFAGMVLADSKAILPELQVFDYDPELPDRLLLALAGWCIRYTPFVSVDAPDGLLLDASGCTHLWTGEEAYVSDISKRLEAFGYRTRIALADTVGAAWALCRFATVKISPPGKTAGALADLPPAALRLDAPVLDRIAKLGLKTIGSFMNMPRTALRRRFGASLLQRLDQALGAEMELIDPVSPVAPYQERLPCLEPVRTAGAIEIALKQLLETLCQRLNREGKGLRKCELRCCRIDGAIKSIAISTGRPSRNISHLFRLFESRISQLEPGLGFELFILEAKVVEELQSTQDVLWVSGKRDDAAISELLDRITGKAGEGVVHRYLPDEHYWPERSFKPAASLVEEPATAWRTEVPRPLHMLQKPEPIEVSVPVPDYPPLLFRYQGVLHTVKKADGPERIEQEWWLGSGLYRDYYCVEDEKGARYWLFRSGDYNTGDAKWYVHGFFA